MVITEQDTRADLAETLAHLNAEAKAEARRGLAGIRGDRYSVLHANIDCVLTSWELAEA